MTPEQEDEIIDRLIAEMIEHGWMEVYCIGAVKFFRPIERPPDDWPFHQELFDAACIEIMERRFNES